MHTTRTLTPVDMTDATPVQDAGVERLLRDPEIKELIAQTPAKAKDIRNAAESVLGHPAAVPALRKIARTLVSGKVHVFLSYKLKEAAIARAVIESLESATGDLEVSYAERWPFGTEWRRNLEQDIRAAHWFILLLPDPSEHDWDWCLYEAGLFKAWMLPGDRLICLHHPDVETPKQLEGLQAVKACSEEVDRFLTSILTEDDAIPGLPALNRRADIHRLSKRICEVIKPPVETVCYDNYLVLEVPETGAPPSAAEFDAAGIVDHGGEAAEIFGFARMPPTWGDLLRPLRQRSKCPKTLGWTEEVFAAATAAMDNLLVEPVQGTFQAFRGGKVYRPILQMKQTWRNRKSQVRIMFIESTGRAVSEEVPLDLEVLATVMRLAYRFHWEISERFGTKAALSDEDMEQIAENMKAIEIEAERRGVMKQEILLRQFDPFLGTQIAAMIERWHELRNRQGRNGLLDIALQDKDGPAVLRVLAEMRRMNHTFLIFVTKRFASSIETLT